MMKKALRLGTWITAPHPTIVDLISGTNLEWVCVDLEHSPVSRLDMQVALTIIQSHGKKGFVRVAQNSHSEIKFPLDAGADGIIIPMVNSAEEARAAISHCFYPPRGMRGVGLARAQRFGFGFKEHLAKNLAELEIIVQIEHFKAVEELDEILQIEGISGVFLGPYDLSASMGIPGEFEHPDMKKAIARVSERTLAAHKLLGAHVITPDHSSLGNYANLGYNFIAFSLDTYFLGQKLNEELSAFRQKNL
jgi:2-dehydro-3-deoxyglucarate aldolase